MKSSSVSIIRCGNYDRRPVMDAVRKSINLLGGLKKFILPGSSVLVKPNLLMAKEPDSGIITHPEVLRSVIVLLKEINCRILVGDGPSVWGNQIENVDDVYRISGTLAVCKEEGVELVKFEKRRMREKFPLTAYLDECDHLINIAKFKSHEFTLMTGAVKNLFGLVSGTYKTELHKNYIDSRDFSGILVDILKEVKPSLSLVDGITALEGDGPATGGRKKQLGLIIAGSDCVAIDAVMAKIMGIEPFDVLSTRNAAERKIGEADISRIQILGEDLNSVIDRTFMLPSNSIIRKKIPAPLKALFKRLVRYYPSPVYDKCIRCFACVKICPQKCIAMFRRGLVFNYRKCIACFCCQEACPAAAIRVRKSFIARLIGL